MRAGPCLDWLAAAAHAAAAAGILLASAAHAGFVHHHQHPDLAVSWLAPQPLIGAGLPAWQLAYEPGFASAMHVFRM